MALAGSRVTLKPFHPDDTPFIDELLNGWEALYLYRQEGVVWGLDDIRRRFDDMRTFTVRESKTEDRIGIARIGDHDPVHQRAELGLYMAEASRGMRLGLHAGILLLHFCFRYLNLEKVLFQVFATNESSLRVVSKLGFSQEGILRSHVFRGGARIDLHLFGLLRHEYENLDELAVLRAEALPQEELGRQGKAIQGGD